RASCGFPSPSLHDALPICREEQALANILDNKMEDLAEDYAVSMEGLIHGDGSSDTKAIAGIRSFILDSPAQGSFGGLSRVTNSRSEEHTSELQSRENLVCR